MAITSQLTPTQSHLQPSTCTPIDLSTHNTLPPCKTANDNLHICTHALLQLGAECGHQHTAGASSLHHHDHHCHPSIAQQPGLRSAQPSARHTRPLSATHERAWRRAFPPNRLSAANTTAYSVAAPSQSAATCSFQALYSFTSTTLPPSPPPVCLQWPTCCCCGCCAVATS